jgi:hypothetical protein
VPPAGDLVCKPWVPGDISYSNQNSVSVLISANWVSELQDVIKRRLSLALYVVGRCDFPTSARLSRICECFLRGQFSGLWWVCFPDCLDVGPFSAGKNQHPSFSLPIFSFTWPSSYSNASLIGLGTCPNAVWPHLNANSSVCNNTSSRETHILGSWKLKLQCSFWGRNSTCKSKKPISPIQPIQSSCYRGWIEE